MTTLLQSFFNTNRWKAALFAFLAGALMTLGFAPYHVWPVIFISLPIFYMLMQATTTRAQSLWRSFFFGYGYSMAGTWWIAKALLVDADKFAWMLPFSVLGLSAVMALWFVAFGYLIYRLRARMSPLLFALVWLMVEVLRSVGIFGFPWNLVGYISLSSIYFAQTASLVGVYGLSLLIVWLGLLPVHWLRDGNRSYKIFVTLVALFIVGRCMLFGADHLHAKTMMTSTTIRIVQPNIPQEVKGTREGVEIATQTLEELSAQKHGDKPADITIWPETAYPFTIRPDKAILLPGFDGVLLTGAVRAEGARPNVKIWNSLFALTPSGDILATYDKHQLVPFGEFVPLRSVLPLDKITPGDIDFSRGSGLQTIAIRNLPPFSPLICYEAIFPWMAVDEKNRPQWILNVTNDAWYGDTAGPYQHFDMARMRAIEQGLPLVRAANNGISAVIDGRGRVLHELLLGERGVIDAPLPREEDRTIYATIAEAFAQL